MILTEEIFNDFKQGKIDCFYKQVYPSLILYASRCLGADFAFLSEDCVQDSVYSTYTLRKSFHSAGHLKTYLYNSIHNAAISVLRKGNSHQNYLSAFDDLSVDLSDSIIEQETLDLLYDAIEHLPDELRTVFSLSFEQGLKNEEIAIQLQCSVGTVKNRKNSIIRFLRQHITARQLVTFLAICPATY
ncbi:RNA polymerase sigma factor [Bacteroides sp. KFT8]|uniref:RNA polymerase sigma factor n=1 Tax=Bacteroides sp. KFT8 TaxID=2025659 RepID=UPI00159B8E99|nr:sigma-70 family RNA polymerase sigma factor [Bacteroides sp. KFT8]